MPLNFKEIADAYDAGQWRVASWRKVPTQTTGSGIWFDLSMSPGNPIPNYYAAAPQIAIALKRSTDVGLDHGQNVNALGMKKYLRTFMAQAVTATAVPLPMIIADYLMFYPFVDMSLVEVVPMTTEIALPRYPTGAGVRILPVLVASQVGGARFRIYYTNSAGVAGRVTPIVTCNTQVVNGTIVTSTPQTAGSTGPFMPLQDDDKGVQLIESVEFITGDVGLLALVLVKPLAAMHIYDITAPVEKDYLIQHNLMPEIKDDAYLNMICMPRGTLAAAPINGLIETCWTTN